MAERPSGSRRSTSTSLPAMRRVAVCRSPRALEARKGQRILDRVRIEPEATYAQYTRALGGHGHPAYSNPQQRGPGHIVGLTWDSAIRKFGIDRGAGVWNDEGNPDKFRFWFAFGDLGKGVAHDLEIAAADRRTADPDHDVRGGRGPLRGGAVRLSAARAAVGAARRHPDGAAAAADRARAARHGAVAARLDDASPPAAAVPRRHDRRPSAQGDALLFRERGRRGVLLGVEGGVASRSWSGTRDYQRAEPQKRIDATVFVDLPANGTRQFVVKLPSPMVDADARPRRWRRSTMRRAREATLKFWSDYVARGAQFSVPEPACQRPVPRQPVARAAAAAPARRRRSRTSPSTCRTPTSPTARPARRGR